MIINVKAQHAQRIADIYNYYIQNTSITFETDPVTANDIENRIAKVQSEFPNVGWFENGVLVGFAYATKFRERKAYDATAEATIYLEKGSVGRGIGKKLYLELLSLLARSGFHTVVGGIALPNEASVSLHESLGFKKIAHFEEVGRKFDKWIDVGFWQKSLSDA